MELKVSKEITCKWQSQRYETYKYVSWALFLKLQAAGINTCRLFSRGVIFTRTCVSLALLSLRKNGSRLVVYDLLHMLARSYKSNLCRGWGEGFLGTKAAHRDLQSFVSLSKGKWRKKNWSRIFLHMNPPGLANNVFIFFLLVKKASNPHMYVFWCSGRLIAKTKTKLYNIF